MSIAKKLAEHLAKCQVSYDLIQHPRTYSSTRTAEAAHVTGDSLAKTVVLHDERGHLLAIVPSTHRVEIEALQRLLDRRLNLATEDEITTLFSDCALGAVPPVGAAYGLDVVLDDSLASESEIYFEAGDHQNLVHMSGKDFAGLMTDARRGQFSHHV